jgi:hypothetical protein
LPWTAADSECPSEEDRIDSLTSRIEKARQLLRRATVIQLRIASGNGSDTMTEMELLEVDVGLRSLILDIDWELRALRSRLPDGPAVTTAVRAGRLEEEAAGLPTEQGLIERAEWLDSIEGRLGGFGTVRHTWDGRRRSATA